MAVTEVDVSKRANTLLIGVQGEVDAQVFRFDISSWIEEYGSGGSASIDLQRPGEKTSYTHGLSIVDGFAVWTVSNIDNAIAGQGFAQLVYTKPGDTKKAKTAEYVTVTERALDEQHGDVPDPYESYLDEARAIYSETAAAAIEAALHEAAAAEAQRAAEAAAADAEKSAQEAQNVFQIAGDTSFSMDPVTRKVTMHITES